MALESCGREMSRMIDNAFNLCHDIVLEAEDIDKIKPPFHVGEEGQWDVHPSMLDGKPAVTIRIAVG